MNDTFIENNVYNPDAEKHPHTVCITLLMSTREHLEKRENEGYNLVNEIGNKLEEKYKKKFPNDDYETIKQQVDIKKLPGEYTGNIEKDNLLLMARLMENPEGFSYRWFKNNGVKGVSTEVVLKKFSEVMDNLNTHGTEMKLHPDMSQPSFLSSDDPRWWRGIQWKDPNTTETFLLVFPSEGMNRKVIDQFTQDPMYRFDPSTKFDKETPALNERQKYLIKIEWN